MDNNKYGFKDKNSDLEDIILKNTKLISKIYKLLLKWFIEEEIVKMNMIKWAINFNKEITMISWEFLWKKASKISVCTKMKANCFKDSI